jgi:hypothetical protein
MYREMDMQFWLEQAEVGNGWIGLMAVVRRFETHEA